MCLPKGSNLTAGSCDQLRKIRNQKFKKTNNSNKLYFDVIFKKICNLLLLL